MARQMIKGAETDRWGDDRHDFDFAEQFPSAMRPACRTATDPLHAIFCDPTAGIARRFVPGGGGGAGDVEAPAAPTQPPAPLDPKDAERKREMGEKGRKLLEERLAKKAAEEANET